MGRKSGGKPRGEPGREQAWVGVSLAGVAGSVDAIGFLGLAHLFTAHMSGNSAALGAYAGQGEWREAAQRAFPIPLFVLGVLTGALMVEGALRRGRRSPFLPALGLEWLLLLTCLLWGHTRAGTSPGTAAYWGVAALLAWAMGIQNATLRRVGRTGVRTTYISGMLTNFAEQGATSWLWLRDRTRGRGRRRLALALRALPRRESVGKMGLFGGIWLGYAAGAILGSVAQGRARWDALALPLLGLAALMVVLRVRPFDAASPIEDKAKQA